jgi:hypothetical protein
MICPNNLWRLATGRQTQAACPISAGPEAGVAKSRESFLSLLVKPALVSGAFQCYNNLTTIKTEKFSLLLRRFALRWGRQLRHGLRLHRLRH